MTTPIQLSSQCSLDVLLRRGHCLLLLRSEYSSLRPVKREVRVVESIAHGRQLIAQYYHELATAGVEEVGEVRVGEPNLV